MSIIVPITINEIIPAPETVLREMGVSRGAKVSERVFNLIEKAIEELAENIEPAGLLREITPEEFAIIYRGKGANAPDTPLEHVFPKAGKLAVFAVTLGNKITEKIGKICTSNDVALGGALNAAASVGADNGVEFCENFFFDLLTSNQLIMHDSCVLAYSPGYCGWHVSGQKKLFSILKPQQIGITLNDTFLMTPLKSVSGVLVAGKREIHYYKPRWDFCESCTSYSCLQRMKSLRKTAQKEKAGEK